ncbi:MAG: adenylate/guanylate cyclase domain-containing protein [Acidimicrobiales bacterium]
MLLSTETLTFLFTDIEGSTALLRRLGADVYADVLAEHHRLIRSCLAANGGTEVSTHGDGFFAVFSSPRACLLAVIEMQRGFGSREWPAGEQLSVRMGVHFGEASKNVTGLYGLEVHRAARIAAVAHGGQILLSATAAGLVRDSLPAGACLQDLGLHRLKDLGRPEQIFQLQAEGLQSEFPPLRSLDNPELPNNLPAQSAPFVGRSREVAEVRRLVSSARLVTLTGAGGSGKTRLGLQVAADLLDGSGEGVWLVELASVSEQGAVASSIAQALGIMSQAGRPALETLLDALSSRQVLIVLDNCEHLIDDCAKVADAILRRCPEIRLLATSQEPLGIAGETIYRVPSMSLPDEDDDTGEVDPDGSDAVALFAERAAAQGVGFVLDRASAPLVAEICRRLDGMPLAIELAASRLRALSLADLNDRLDQRFRLLTGGSRNAIPRQQTLLATVDWSYSLLTASEQKLLRRLSVFVDGFQLDAAEAVCAGGDLDVFAVTDLVASLVDKNLVVAEPADSALRYRLLETIRQFAAERLVESGGSEADELAKAHCLHFLSVAEASRAAFAGREQAKWIRRLNAEQGNIWRAIDHAADAADMSEGTEQVLRFGAALVRYWVENGQRERALGVLVRVLERPEASADPSLRSAALASAAMVARGVDMELALRLGEEAMEIADQLGEDRLLIESGTVLCCLLYFAGLLNRGLAYGESAVERARRSGDDSLLGPSLVFLLMCVDQVQPGRSEALTGEAIACVERSGDRSLAGTLYNNAGVHSLRKGDLPSARRFLQYAEEANRALGLQNSTPMINLGWVLRQEGDEAGSAEAFRRALRESHRVGDGPDMPYAMLGLACEASDTGDWRRSAVLHGFANALIGNSGEPWQDPEDTYRRQSLDETRANLGDVDFEAAFGRGASLDLRSAIDLALDPEG